MNFFSDLKLKIKMWSFLPEIDLFEESFDDGASMHSTRSSGSSINCVSIESLRGIDPPNAPAIAMANAGANLQSQILGWNEASSPTDIPEVGSLRLAMAFLTDISYSVS